MQSGRCLFGFLTSALLALVLSSLLSIVLYYHTLDSGDGLAPDLTGHDFSLASLIYLTYAVIPDDPVLQEKLKR